jgi:hypothetical protein
LDAGASKSKIIVVLFQAEKLNSGIWTKDLILGFILRRSYKTTPESPSGRITWQEQNWNPRGNI